MKYQVVKSFNILHFRFKIARLKTAVDEGDSVGDSMVDLNKPSDQLVRMKLLPNEKGSLKDRMTQQVQEHEAAEAAVVDLDMETPLMSANGQQVV